MSILTPSVAVAPEGRHVAYVSRHGDSTKLYLRSMNRPDAILLEGAGGARMPFFPPDGQWLGFLMEGKLMKLFIGGGALGAPVTLREVGEAVRGASWGPGGWIVYNRRYNSGLSRISEAGGEPEELTTPDRKAKEKTHRFPEVLPGGKAVLFTLGTGDIASFDEAKIALLDLETGRYRIVVEGGSHPRYVPTGHLVFARGGALFAVFFDLNALEARGAPIPVLAGVATSGSSGHAEFGISRNGTLVYAPGGSWGNDRRVIWVDRGGRRQPLIETQGAYFHVRIAPNGRALAFGVEGANTTVRVYDLARGTLRRLTFEYDNVDPIWTPDSRQLTFRSSRLGTTGANLFWQAADGSGQAEQLTTGEHDKSTGSWSPDGKALAFEETRPESGADIWILNLDGDRTPRAFLQSRFNEQRPVFSPDGRFIAYESDESGRYEIYLCRFSDSTAKWQVSTEGGRGPRFRSDGRELFYRNGDKMMAVDIDSSEELVLGKPVLLFERAVAEYGSAPPAYDVAPDGRFVMVEEGQSEPPPTRLNIVLNRGEELRRRVPAN